MKRIPINKNTQYPFKKVNFRHDWSDKYFNELVTIFELKLCYNNPYHILFCFVMLMNQFIQNIITFVVVADEPNTYVCFPPTFLYINHTRKRRLGNHDSGNRKSGL